MSAPTKPPSLLLTKKKIPPPKLMKKIESVVVKKPLLPPISATSRPTKSTPKPHLNGAARKDSPQRLQTPHSSRPNSKEPVERIKTERTKSIKRSSPTITTPQFSSDSEDAEPQPRKRPRTDELIDPNRRIRDPEAFTEGGIVDSERVHAYDIANSSLQKGNNSMYLPFFTALAEDEDVEPIIELEYPGAAVQPERWQIVQPSDHTDFKPITEILDHMNIVREHYLDETSARKVFDFNGSGIYQALDRARKQGEKKIVGAQTRFTDAVSLYNKLIRERRTDGTIAKAIDDMRTVPTDLIKHIINSEIYSRTISPKVNTVLKYEPFSDNVYGELLPKFLTRIFKETRLRSGQIFVDMGSGVGNCVLQAALETGCEAWGCEMMDNPAKLAELQAKEFPVRCKLWGLKPGPIHLIHDDFLQNRTIGEVLKRADVILLNNQAFTPELNDKIKLKFLDLKEGAQIVSLKYYRDPLHRIKDTNKNDLINVLQVQEKERFSGMVSWSNDPGKWYLHTKDRRELDSFQSS